MTREIIYRPLARAEFDEAAEVYEAASPGLGRRFTLAVDRVVEEVAATPDRYPVAAGDTRAAPVPDFPFCVYYRVRPDRVMITAVYHQSRDPAGWQSRR